MADVIGPAPARFGLVWADQGMRQTVNGPRRMSIAQQTPSLRGAWTLSSDRAMLRSWGYSPRGEDGPVLHWGDGVERDLSALHAIEARGQAAWDAREAAILAAAEQVVEVKRRLQATLDLRGWAMSPQGRVKAGRLLAARTLDEKAQGEAIAIVLKAAIVEAETAEAVAAQAEAQASGDLAAVAEPAMRAEVLAGLRWVTSADEDRAAEVNQAGWCRATSRPGHWLSARESLDQGQAAVGMALLRRFARQLPADMLGRLGLPVPRRRAA